MTKVLPILRIRPQDPANSLCVPSYTGDQTALHRQTLTKGKIGRFPISYTGVWHWTNASLVVTVLPMDFANDSVLREALMDSDFSKTSTVSNRLWAKLPIALFLISAVILVGSLAV